MIGIGRLDVQCCDRLFGALEFLCVADKAKRAGNRVEVSDADVASNRNGAHDALQTPLFRHETVTVGDRLLDSRFVRLAEIDDLTAVVVVDAVDGTHQFGPAGADEATETEHLAFAHLERNVLQFAFGTEIFDLKDKLAVLLDHPVMRFIFGQFAADHQADDLGGRDLLTFKYRHQLAVAQYGHPVGEVVNFLHAVRDINDGNAFFLEHADDLEQPFAFGRGQRTGRLVHDHQRSLV